MMRIYLSLLALALGLSTAVAQTTLPRAVYTLDFEDITDVSEINGTQIGEGTLVTSDDENFGQYYQNCPTEASSTPLTNYLRVTTDALVTAVEKTTDQCVSIGVWVNPTVANTDFSDISYYYSVLYSFYGADNRELTSLTGPMWTVDARGWVQINDWAGHWNDFPDDQNTAGENNISIDWLAQGTEEVTLQAEDGSDSIAYVETGFDDNWHYVAFVLNAAENLVTLYVDGELFNQWLPDEADTGYYLLKNTVSDDGILFDGMSQFDDLYLGGCAPWGWEDPEPAFAYDDFTIYAGELGTEQQELVMKIKRGEVDEDVQLALAQAEYETALNDYEALDVEEYASIAEQLETAIDSIDDIVFDNPTVENYTSGAATILALVAAAEEVIDYAEEIKANIAEQQTSAAATQYAGYETYAAALTELLAALADPTTTDEVAAVEYALQVAHGAYLASQELPEDGSGVDFTDIILHPWFCESEAEPTYADGTYTFPNEDNYTENYTPSDANSDGWVNGNTFVVDDYRVNWTEGRICWNNWHASTTVGTLDVHQEITGLPAGYYAFSFDWITSSTVTTQHSYITCDETTKISSYLTELGWDDEEWTTLTTDKILVGEEGTIVIGAESTTNGTAYEGWFCVTNAVLTYYGTEVDLSEDLADKIVEATELANSLLLAGDRTNALATIEEIAAGDDVYTALTALTEYINEMNDILETEEAFTAADDLSDAASAATDEQVKAVYTVGAADLAAVVQADTTTVDALPALEELYSAYISYGAVLESAIAWGTDDATNLVAEQVAAIEASAPTAEELAAYQEALLEIMKNSVDEKEASVDSPVDITSFLSNPSFTDDSTDGWTYTDDGEPSVYYEECEFYNTNFDIYQVVSGLPAGYYRFTCTGFYRDGSNDDAYANSITMNEDSTEYEPSNVLNAEIYANDFATSIASWAEFYQQGNDFCESNTYTPDNTLDDEEILYFCNTMYAAYTLFSTGDYDDYNVVDTYVSEGEDLTVGIRKTTTITYDWTIFDDFHLYYIGQDTPTGIGSVSASTGGSVVSSQIFTVSGTRVSALQQGVNIVRQHMADGTTQTVKVLVK